MAAPRLDIDLTKIGHNARTLVEKLGHRGISVTGVTKAVLGLPDIAEVLLSAGIQTLGDSRIENIETMSGAKVEASMALIRSPMLSQVDRVVRHAHVSFNTELCVLRELSIAAQREKCIHGVVLMVELGDLREGIVPSDIEAIVRKTIQLPNIVFRGIGTNLACCSGVAPSERNMSELSQLAIMLEKSLNISLDTVSGGNSANLNWALRTSDPGKVNNLRLGESILLGREALHRQPIEGLHTDAIALTAEVIELKVKPSQPRGEIGQTAFGEHRAMNDRGSSPRAILAVGLQDVDASGLSGPPDTEILGASSDHLIVDPGGTGLTVGSEMVFSLNYSALVRAMVSPFIAKVLRRGAPSDRYGSSSSNVN